MTREQRDEARASLNKYNACAHPAETLTLVFGTSEQFTQNCLHCTWLVLETQAHFNSNDRFWYLMINFSDH